MNRKQSLWLVSPLVLLGQLAIGLSAALAGDFNLQNTAEPDTKDISSAEAKEATTTDAGIFGSRRFHLTFDSRIGYDSNTLAQPDVNVTFRNAAGNLVSRSVSGDDSVFLNFDLGATYTAATSRSTLTVAGDVGVSYYFDRPGRKYDVNGALSLLFTYKLAPRWFLSLSSFNAYISEGDFGASNLTNFTGSTIAGVRAPGTTNNLNGDYFYTTESVTLAYQLSQRISLVTGYALTAFAYDDSLYATVDDRVEQYFSEEFRFLLQPQLTLAADYRFSYVDYFGVSNDSYSNFVLAGVDYLFSPRLRGSFRAGAEFRVYTDQSGANENSPYAEATVTYDLSRRANLALIARYGIEEGGLTTTATNANTLRLGISYNQSITARISGYLSFYYTHSRFETPSGAVVDFNEDTYDVAVGARYAINRNFSLEIGYTHTSVDSDIDTRSYNRERAFGGVRLAF